MPTVPRPPGAPSTPQKKPLSDGQRFGLGLAITGMLAVGAYGLVISYWTVRELAEKLSMPLPHIFPVGIEGGMIAVLAIDIMLTWIGRPIGWLRQVARALSATAIGINAYAGMEYGAAAVVMHALAPAILIVGVEALRHHLLVVLQVPEEKEPIPKGRWLLAPISSAAMGRRMVLWQQPKYSEALDVHLDRHEAIAELKRAFGWRWKKRIPAGLAYRLSVGVRLEQSTAEVRELLAVHYARTHAEDAHTVRLMDEHTPTVRAHEMHEAPVWREPVRVPITSGVHTIVGGDRVDGYLDPGERTLIPVECAQHAQERSRVLAEGAAAVAQIEAWRAQDRAQETRTRMRAQAMSAAAGGTPRALPERTRARDELGFAHAEHTPAPAVSTPAAREHTGPEVVTERVPGGAATSRRAQGERTRERITEHMKAHPAHTAEQIAEHIGVHPSTVRRHLRTMSA